MRRVYLFSTLIVYSYCLVIVPSLFRDGCVLQTSDEGGAPARVYGDAAVGEVVHVAVTFDSGGTPDEYTATSDARGQWAVQLKPLAVSDGAFSLTIRGTVAPVAPPIIARNCVAGDVIVAGGQSNMCFSAEAAFPPGPALANASYPFLRLFAVPMASATTPQPDFEPTNSTYRGQCWWNHDREPAEDTSYVCSSWMPSTPETNGLFSAVCLFTALRIAAEHTGTRPLGLIYSAFGGTSVSLWAPPAQYAHCPNGSIVPKFAGKLWNSMIAPLTRFSRRTHLWLQGEADSDTELASPGWYECRLSAMIALWRAAALPVNASFNVVSLGAVYNPARDAPVYSGTGAVRIAQAGVAATVPAVDSAIAYDLGDRMQNAVIGSVHFRNKTAVGVRLAAAVLRSAYGVPASSTARGPRVVNATTDGAAKPTAFITLATDDGSSIALVDGQECVNCCSGAEDTVVFGASAHGPWTRSHPPRLEGGVLIATANARGVFSHVAIAVADYPECAPLAVDTGFPLPPGVYRLHAQ